MATANNLVLGTRLQTAQQLIENVLPCLQPVSLNGRYVKLADEGNEIVFHIVQNLHDRTSMKEVKTLVTRFVETQLDYREIEAIALELDKVHGIFLRASKIADGSIDPVIDQEAVYLQKAARRSHKHARACAQVYWESQRSSIRERFRQESQEIEAEYRRTIDQLEDRTKANRATHKTATAQFDHLLEEFKQIGIQSLSVRITPEEKERILERQTVIAEECSSFSKKLLTVTEEFLQLETERQELTKNQMEKNDQLQRQEDEEIHAFNEAHRAELAAFGLL